MKFAIVTLLLTGCTTMQLDMSPNADRYVRVEQFHNSIESVEKVCGKGNVGCWVFKNGVHYTDMIKSWCVKNHEDEHVYHGKFHSKPATCEVRDKHF